MQGRSDGEGGEDVKVYLFPEITGLNPAGIQQLGLQSPLGTLWLCTIDGSLASVSSVMSFSGGQQVKWCCVCSC